MKGYFSITILSFWILSSFGLFAQEGTKLYLVPSLGLEWSFSKFDEKKSIPPYIKSTSTPSAARYGLGVMVDFKNKWGLEFGYSGADLGWGLEYESKTDSVENKLTGSRMTYTTVQRAYLQFYTPGKFIVIRKKRGVNFKRRAKIKRDYDYWAIFDLGIMGGIAVEYLPPFSYVNSSNLNATGRDYDRIAFSEVYTEGSNRRGIGLNIGLYSQFLQAGKKRLQIGVFYHKGIQKRIVSNWSTSINGIVYPDFTTFTRGSYLAFYASYPMKLFTMGGKKSKKFNEN